MRVYNPQQRILRQLQRAIRLELVQLGVSAVDRDIKLHATFFCQTGRDKDVDNMAKFAMDVLTGLVYVDDRQVIYLEATKIRGSPLAKTNLVIEY